MVLLRKSKKMRAKTVFFAPIRIIKYIINKKQFGSIGWRTYIEKPLRIDCKKNIFLENGVHIASYCWLAAKPKTSEKGKARLIIKEGSAIGDFAHIYATQEIIIDRNVLLANFVYISDNLHGYEDINIPVIQQSIVQKKPVHIGEGSWLGEHVCVIGASIGKQCVIGANSVVTRDIPDYCIAVGSPARIIKKFNLNTQKWEKVKQE